MAKSSRSSSRKENNRRKATTIFGPAELARDARLSAKLLALAKQPKPVASPEVKMDRESCRSSTRRGERPGGLLFPSMRHQIG